ncbi:hypothetical protein DDB_G0293624 [Dictyostelium discoideum AX4]|uniref:Uncharacterized protein n=1 Tax=Dictyostelium discoideum TaxID=44689 RepID=Q54BH2_DICDI|nr:hypothetical protein DDB_G0293624 [Dictyostelium discoideum AX4]EAL60624.1 hypothetical protein DDB_G0293624 [Dictyostelium discoideum AX4]|eukprot:XP_629057.1 hypothetical protein DDB_G0293624 [Dictyostelium discoideum AX4]
MQNSNNLGLSLEKKDYHNKSKIIDNDDNNKEKIYWLNYDIENIKKELQELQDEENQILKDLEPFKKQIKELEEIEKRNLDKVHTYNEIKDATQNQIGKLAEYEGVTIIQMTKKLGIFLNSDEK